MSPSRNSIAWWLVATVLVALLLAPLAHLTDIGNLVLMYSRFTLMILATFLARFGNRRQRSWWFGFSTVGWARLSRPALPTSQFNKLTAVVETYMTLLAAVGGGIFELVLDRPRRRGRRGKIHRNQTQ